MDIVTVNNSLIQSYDPLTADIFEIENQVDPFGAEQTWPTRDEFEKRDELMHDEYKDSYNNNSESKMNEEPLEMPTGIENQFKIPAPKKKEDDMKDLAKRFERMEIQVMGGGPGEESINILEDEDDVDDDFSTIEYQSQMNKSSFKHQKMTSIEQREKDEMDFPDEVDTPLDQPARERFQQYRSIKNIKTCDWDPFESLPPAYAKIWRFENFNQIKKAAVQQTEVEGLPIDGTYIKLKLEPLDEKSKNGLLLLSTADKKAIIFSTLLPHETKVSVCHFKIKRFDEDKTVIPSKCVLEFHVGFRKFLTRPIFSDDYYNTNKAKYYRFLQHDVETLVSAYTPICYPPSQVIIFRRGDHKEVEKMEVDHLNEKPSLVASGTAIYPDPLKIILKRIVLTGYPIKCKRKRAVIRYMFFNPLDIKYF